MTSRGNFYQEMLKSTYAAHRSQEEAWKRFCGDMGTDPSDLQAAYCIEPNAIWSIAVRAAERMNPVVPLDDELVEANLESFREAWTR
jgi:hypothetical protein